MFSEFASMLDAIESSFTGWLVLLSDSSSLAARARWRVGEVIRDGCDRLVVEVLPSLLVHDLFDSIGFTCTLAFERSDESLESD